MESVHQEAQVCRIFFSAGKFKGVLFPVRLVSFYRDHRLVFDARPEGAGVRRFRAEGEPVARQRLKFDGTPYRKVDIAPAFAGELQLQRLFALRRLVDDDGFGDRLAGFVDPPVFQPVFKRAVGEQIGIGAERAGQTAEGDQKQWNRFFHFE